MYGWSDFLIAEISASAPKLEDELILLCEAHSIETIQNIEIEKRNLSRIKLLTHTFLQCAVSFSFWLKHSFV